MSDWKITHVNGKCVVCGGTGMKVLHRQGDPVEGVEQTRWSRTVYASTIYVTCDCCVVRSVPVVVAPFEPGTCR